MIFVSFLDMEIVASARAEAEKGFAI